MRCSCFVTSSVRTIPRPPWLVPKVYAHNLACVGAFRHVHTVRYLTHGINSGGTEVRLFLYNPKCHTIAMLQHYDDTEAWVSAFKRGTRLRYTKGEFIIRPGEAPQ